MTPEGETGAQHSAGARRKERYTRPRAGATRSCSATEQYNTTQYWRGGEVDGREQLQNIQMSSANQPTSQLQREERGVVGREDEGGGSGWGRLA